MSIYNHPNNKKNNYRSCSVSWSTDIFPSFNYLNRGYGCHCKIDDLPPDSVLVFRMKNNTDYEWGSEVVASTTRKFAVQFPLSCLHSLFSLYILCVAGVNAPFR